MTQVKTAFLHVLLHAGLGFLAVPPPPKPPEGADMSTGEPDQGAKTRLADRNEAVAGAVVGGTFEGRKVDVRNLRLGVR